MSDALITGIVVFVLATYLGAELIGRVPPSLHTPLMSGANAISGITVVGGILIAAAGLGWISNVLGFLAVVLAMMNVVGGILIAAAGFGWISNVLGFLAVVLAMMNVVGGYAVTDRMLQMFRKEEKK